MAAAAARPSTPTARLVAHQRPQVGVRRPIPESIQVFHFLLVTVDASPVTVTPDRLPGTDLRRAAARPLRGLPERRHVGDSRGASRRTAHNGRVLEPRREQGMDTPDERAATAATRAGRGPLLRRPEVRRWAHHVADLNSGEIHTGVLDAPPTSTSHVEGLSRLGSVGGTTIFNGPSFVLTTRIPYVASPEHGWRPISTTSILRSGCSGCRRTIRGT
jgi:hypothetical protein